MNKLIPRTLKLGSMRHLCTTLSSRSQNDQNYSKDKVTHFGFEDNVSEIDKKKKVLKVFDSVAESYDKMNDAMSFGVHRLWKDKFVDVLNPPEDLKLLDVAGGTGNKQKLRSRIVREQVSFHTQMLS